MAMDRDPNVYDRETPAYDRDRGGSSFLAWLIGGIVVVIGLLAFLFWDGNWGNEVSTTSSVNPPAASAPAHPATTPAPAPAAPAAPVNPAPANPAAPK